MLPISSVTMVLGPHDHPDDALPAIGCSPGKRPSDIPEAEWASMSKRQRKALVAARKSEEDDVEAQRDKFFHALAAAEVPNNTPSRGRVLIEYCCSSDSRLGTRAGDCEVVRLTESIDMTTDAGLHFALDAVETAYHDNKYVALWASLPCTAGCPWQAIIKKYRTARRKIRRHLKVFKKLMANFIKVAEHVREAGGDIHFEWPAGCRLWETNIVRKFINDYSLNRVTFHGCSVGLAAADGRPIKKPWAVATTSLQHA